jgi:hypothetical protein
MRAEEKATRRRNTTGVIPIEGPRIALWRSVASIPLVAGRTRIPSRSSSRAAVLQMTTSTYCGWSLYLIFCGQTNRVSVYAVYGTPTWAQDNSNALRQHEHQARFSACAWTGIVGETVLGPYLLPDRLSAQWYCDFLGTLLQGKCIKRRRPILCPPRSPDLTPLDFCFLLEQLKEHVYAVPRRKRLQATLTTVDTNLLRRARESAVRLNVVCLERDGVLLRLNVVCLEREESASKNYCTYKAPRVW